jgi:5-methyltetrahydropteroyltriglutamate--homocysteine methyltransferase
VVEQRLHRALEVLPKEVIWVDPDCGLKTRTVNEAIAKMQSVVTAAKALRKNSDE